MNLFVRVYSFMRRFAQETPGEPTIPSDEVIRNRCRWQVEETIELLKACMDKSFHCHLDEAAAIIEGSIKWAPVAVDLVAYADANADIRYIAYGNDIAAGIDSREIDAEVCRSNDSKSQPAKPGDKIIKGPNYSPPQIAAILHEQGWKRSA